MCAAVYVLKFSTDLELRDFLIQACGTGDDGDIG